MPLFKRSNGKPDNWNKFTAQMCIESLSQMMRVVVFCSVLNATTDQQCTLCFFCLMYDAEVVSGLLRMGCQLLINE